MTNRCLDMVFLGLSLSSSWGNGHATTYRALLRGLAERGHRLLFLERDVPWYATSRDLADPGFCDLAFYQDLDDLRERFSVAISAADAVIVGSYVPDGIAVIDYVNAIAGGVRGFYDIDTPVTVAALEQDRCTYLAARQVPTFDLYLSFTGGPLLDYLTERFGARRPRPLYCGVDTTLYRPEKAPSAWDLGYLGTYAADRQPALERLLLEPARRLPRCRFVVAGPQYPDTIQWPPNVERIEHLPPAQHTAFYNRQRFTLNITRADMIRTGWSPSVRLFEAAACGTPIISDRWAGLNELLPDGDAILIAGHSDDVEHALEFIDEPTRTRIGAAARSIVLARHTGVARARELEQHVHVCMAPMPPLDLRQSTKGDAPDGRPTHLRNISDGRTSPPFA
jgi:spore maturation protein CgeB